MSIGSGLSRTHLVIFFLFRASSAVGDSAVLSSTPAVDDRPPGIVLIIDDLGNWRRAGMRATSLPGPVACAVLPHTPFGSVIAERAHAVGKEVMLHLPLAPIQHDAISTGTIFIDITRAQLSRIFLGHY